MKYTWSFPQFIVNPTSGGLSNVVTAINWVCTGTDGLVTSSSSGTVQLGSPNPAEFVPYDQITQEMAFNWVSQSISVSGVESAIAAQIKQISAPQIQPQNPPF
jgi:hypothetical protein